jgi:asparagine synthetase B (glutamine-hydrolysing)
MFRRGGWTGPLEPVLSRQADVLSVRGVSFQRRQWADHQFGAVNLLKPDIDELEQPAQLPGGQVLFLDGEIYNIAELARTGSRAGSDRGGLVAQCLELYASDPIGTARRLNGSFNLAYYDPQRHLLHLVSDRLGSRPLYYQERRGILYFALEQKAILAAHGDAPAFDDLALLQLAAFGHQLGERTMFAGISVLPPGSLLTAGANGVTITSYWRAAYHRGHKGGPEASAELARRFIAATQRRTVRRRAPLGIFLSGGLDSRFVAGALATTHAPVSAFTFGEEANRDVRFARQIASRLGFSHQVYAHRGHDFTATLPQFVWRTEGTMSFPEGLSIEFHRHIWPRARVIFNGHLGDALSGGHLLPELFWLPRRDLAAHILRKRTRLSKERLRALCAPEHFDALYHQLTSSVAYGLDSLNEDRTALLYNLWDLDVRQRRYTQSTPAVDRYVLEPVSPFLDNDVVELCLGLPISELFGQRCYLRAILDAFPSCADVPWARTGRAIERNHALRLSRLGAESVLRKSRRMLRIGTQLPVQQSDDEFRSSGLRTLALAYTQADAFPDRVFDRKAMQSLVHDYFDRGEDRLEEVGLLLTLASASDLLFDGLRSVPPAAQPDFSTDTGVMLDEARPSPGLLDTPPPSLFGAEASGRSRA